MNLARRAGMYGRVCGDANFTVGASAGALPNVPPKASAALITVGIEAIRVRFGGGVPTAAIGHAVVAGGVIEVFGKDIGRMQLISQGGDSTCFVTYYEAL